MSTSAVASFPTTTAYPPSGFDSGTTLSQSSTYLQSVIISLVALALILVISIIFLYYRRQRLRRYSAAEWPFPNTFRSNVHGSIGGGRNGGKKDFGQTPEMWEVEVTDGEKWDGRESGDEEGKESFMTSRSLGEEIENWKPLSALALNPMGDFKSPSLDPHSSRTITSSSSILSISTGSSVQISLLIAMPTPPSYRDISRTQEADAELPDVELGFCCVNVDDEEGERNSLLPPPSLEKVG